MIRKRSIYITRILPLVLVLLIAGVGWYAYRGGKPNPNNDATNQPKSSPSSASNPTRTTRILEFYAKDWVAVETRNIERSLFVTGQLRPIAQALIRSKMTGEVIAMPVREGQYVKAGELLVQIDPTEYRQRVLEREGILAANQSQWEYNERTRKNNENLVQRNFISRQAYDNGQTSSDVSHAQVQTAKAQLNQAQKQLDDTRIVAPINGVVSERRMQVGDKAAPDSPLLTLVDLSRMELEINVPVMDTPLLSVGQKIAFQVEGFAGRNFQGAIARVGAVANARMLPVYVEMDNPQSQLKGGMFATGRMILGQSTAVPSVPISAVREESSQTMVYALEEGRILRIPVVLGNKDSEGYVEVKGLKPGVKILRNNLAPLPIGELVTIKGE